MAISKKEFQFRDRIIKGIEENGRFKISVVKTTEVVRAAQKNHGLSLLNTVLLGRTLTAAMLLASELKGEERVKIRLDGNGPVGMILAEANRVGEIRGYVQYPKAELDYSDESVSAGDGIGSGLLTISKILYNEAEPHTSTIEIAKGDILSDMVQFMVRSEQIPSAFQLDVSLNDDGTVNQAGGLLIQRLPGVEDDVMEELEKTISGLPAVTELLSQGDYIDVIMEKASAPFAVKELNRQPVHFFCRCNAKRFKSALTLLSYQDLKELQGEDQEMVCHFCGAKHRVREAEIYAMIESAQAKLN